MAKKANLGPRTLASVALMATACALGPSDEPSEDVAVSSSNELSGDSPSPPFYTPPAPKPGDPTPKNGDLVRSEPMSFLLEPASAVPVTATRILYRSTRRNGSPMDVSGSVVVPKARWTGRGKRPVIGYGVGTQGIGDGCAPSRALSEGFEYEAVFMSGLLARGYALAITDYEGLGTPGMHTYMDRLSQGHAVLDAVRAAERLPGSDLSDESPVALYGYSQGGGAAASAAELASSYAPELQIKGTVAGAVPADLSVLPANLDGGIWAEFLWFAIAGIAESYDVDILPLLNANGAAFYDKISSDCVFDLGNSMLKKSKDYTADGSTLAQIAALEPFRTMLEEQRIGRLKPNAPVLVTHSLFDDIIPFSVGRQLAKDWCARGATVQFSPNITPLHLGAMLNNATQVYGFLEARFAGVRPISTCQ